MLRSCHSGIEYYQGEARDFYESFVAGAEKYLESIGVYRKDIKPGEALDNSNAKWFKNTYYKETKEKQRVGTIDEIEIAPHFIPFQSAYNEPDELIVPGICVAFREAKNK